MAKTVQVTRAQRVATRYLRERARQRGEVVDPRLNVIAEAKPKSMSSSPDEDEAIGSASAGSRL